MNGTKTLNREQLLAARHKDGPMMVLAGPGSGKTTVLCTRVLYLTKTCKVPPEQLLVITFTRAAAAEMEKRCMEQSAECFRSHKPEFGTFHSAFFQILRETEHYTPQDIIGAAECQKLLWEIAKEEVPSYGGISTDFASLLLGELSKQKNEGKLLSAVGNAIKLPEILCTPERKKELWHILMRYQAELARRHLLDFDDMLLLCLEKLKKDRNLLFKLRKRWQYLMIDEFQDINRVQYEIVRLLAWPRNNLFIVGDDDQGIYGFRGARPELMLRFPHEYPDAKRILLRKNYRSSAEVVEASLRLIRTNKQRFEKDLIAQNRGGTKPEVCGYASAKAEAEAIIAKLKKRLAAGLLLSDAAILYRSRRAAITMRQCLQEAGLWDSKRQQNGESQDMPCCMTFHASKGLEFDEVFLIGANEGITPAKEAVSSAEQLEEERRMFYVAMTRAKRLLHISFTNGSYNKEKWIASRFIEECIPTEHPGMDEGKCQMKEQET